MLAFFQQLISHYFLSKNIFLNFFYPENLYYKFVKLCFLAHFFLITVAAALFGCVNFPLCAIRV